MKTKLLTLLAFAVAWGFLLGAFALGEKWGSHKTATEYQRIALSKAFGYIEEQTLVFKWADGYGMKLPK